MSILRKWFAVIASLVVLTITTNPSAFCAGKSSTGWTLFRKLQSVRPKALTSTYYFPGDISGALYNPSLLSLIQGSEINIDASTGFSDERVAGVMYGHRLNNDLVAGFGVFSYDYGQIELNWIEGNEIMARTVAAQSDYMGMFSLAKSIGPRLNAGLNVKLASSRIAEEATAYAFAVDGGINYALKKNIMLSLVGQNIGASTPFIDKSEALPTAIMGGASYLGSIGEFYYVGGIELPFLLMESALKPGVGLELGRWPLGFFMGYRTYVDDAPLTYGINLAFKGYDFSYSYTPAQWLGNMHRIALAFKLGQETDVRNEVKTTYQEQAPEREKKRKEKELQKKQEAQRQQELQKEHDINAQLQQLLARKPINLNVIADQITAVTMNYYAGNVVDHRSNKEYIGVVKSDIDNEYHPMQLAGGIESSLLDFFGQVLPRSADKTPLVATVTRLEFSEIESSIVVEGLKPIRLQMAIDFTMQKDSSTICVHRAETEGSIRYIRGKDTLEVVELFEADIRQGLIDCIASLSNNNWGVQNRELPLIEPPQPMKLKGEVKEEKQSEFANLNGTSRTGGIGIYYQNSGLLFEYKREKPLGNDNYAGFGIGYYQNYRAPIKVSYGNGGTVNYTLNSRIIPVSASVCHVVKTGVFRGKWGIGASVFAYNATITDHYSGSGLGGNFFIPFEGVLWSKPTQDGYFVRLDLVVRLLGTTQEFNGTYDKITNVRLFDGNSYGITIGKKF